MSCCGGTYRPPTPPEPSAGEVVVRPLWGGVTLYRGRVTGRLYGYISDARLVAVAVEDAQADPRLVPVAPLPAAPSEPTEEPRAPKRKRR